MMMIDFNLFAWWAATISGGSIFQVLVAIYIYIKQRKKRKESKKKTKNVVDLLKEFIFVWILLGLLVFYMISIRISSATIFAVGNIFVEVILIVYLMKNKLAE
jgi:L-asparagine transporter-like permease